MTQSRSSFVSKAAVVRQVPHSNSLQWIYLKSIGYIYLPSNIRQNHNTPRCLTLLVRNCTLGSFTCRLTFFIVLAGRYILVPSLFCIFSPHSCTEPRLSTARCVCPCIRACVFFHFPRAVVQFVPTSSCLRSLGVYMYSALIDHIIYFQLAIALKNCRWGFERRVKSNGTLKRSPAAKQGAAEGFSYIVFTCGLSCISVYALILGFYLYLLSSLLC